MPTPSRIKVGRIACLCCTREVLVKKAPDTGSLSVSCPECDLSAYALAGTEAHRLITARMKPMGPEAGGAAVAPPAASPAPVVAQVTEDTPAPKKGAGLPWMRGLQ